MLHGIFTLFIVRRIGRLAESTGEKFTMNSPKTIEHIENQMTPAGKEKLNEAKKSGIGDPKVRLHGKGEEFYLTGKGSGRYLTDEHPGKTPLERKENLQLPKGNDAKDVDKVRSTKARPLLESRVAPQEGFAKDSGYEPREGMKQIITPTKDYKLKDGKDEKSPMATGMYENLGPADK